MPFLIFQLLFGPLSWFMISIILLLLWFAESLLSCFHLLPKHRPLSLIPWKHFKSPVSPTSLLTRKHCLLHMYHKFPVLTCLLRFCCMLVVTLDLRPPSQLFCELSHSENLNSISCTLSCVGAEVSSTSGCYPADDWTEASFNARSQQASQSVGALRMGWDPAPTDRQTGSRTLPCFLFTECITAMERWELRDLESRLDLNKLLNIRLAFKIPKKTSELCMAPPHLTPLFSAFHFEFLA